MCLRRYVDRSRKRVARLTANITMLHVLPGKASLQNVHEFYRMVRSGDKRQRNAPVRVGQQINHTRSTPPVLTAHAKRTKIHQLMLHVLHCVDKSGSGPFHDTTLHDTARQATMHEL